MRFWVGRLHQRIGSIHLLWNPTLRQSLSFEGGGVRYKGRCVGFGDTDIWVGIWASTVSNLEQGRHDEDREGPCVLSKLDEREWEDGVVDPVDVVEGALEAGEHERDNVGGVNEWIFGEAEGDKNIDIIAFLMHNFNIKRFSYFLLK